MAFWAMQLANNQKIAFAPDEVKHQSCFGFYEPPSEAFKSLRQPLENHFASLKRVSLVYEASLNERPCISSSSDAIAFFKRYWSQSVLSDQERFIVACLDTKNRVQCVVEVTVGTLDASLVHPREVFKPAFIEGSSSIILSHNHPSGAPRSAHVKRNEVAWPCGVGQWLEMRAMPFRRGTVRSHLDNVASKLPTVSRAASQNLTMTTKEIDVRRLVGWTAC